MPFLLFILSVATLVAVSSKSKAAPNGGGGGHSQTFTLDANMPDALRNQVLAALVSGTDPATLDAFATAIQTQYPLSAGLLHAKATSLRSASSTGPIPPSLPIVATNDPGGPPLDPSMPPAMVAFVHAELLNETDPNKLLALASTIGAQFPVAGELLAQRAAVLNVQPSPSPNPIPMPGPTPSPQPTPANPPAPVLTMPGLDPGMPADVAQAVMGELVNDNDPPKLQAYALQIQPQYPVAASVLVAKANTILSLQPSPAPSPSPSPLPTIPVSTADTYVVQEGDYPWKIATKITGHGARWPELVAANPSKARAKDGNFATLLPGEKLSLPPSWSRAPAPSNAPFASTPSMPPVIAPQPSPAPVIAPAPLNAPPAGAGDIALDPNIPPDVASAVTNALQTATDPNQVRGFASAIAPKYPKAAQLLTAKANALSAFGPSKGIVVADVAPGTGAPSAATYKVKSGDSPSKIAAALVHDGNRWKELVAANPQKKRAANGNFASLVPGEVLQLPASWSNGAVAKPATAPQGGA